MRAEQQRAPLADTGLEIALQALRSELSDVHFQLLLMLAMSEVEALVIKITEDGAENMQKISVSVNVC